MSMGVRECSVSGPVQNDHLSNSKFTWLSGADSHRQHQLISQQRPERNLLFDPAAKSPHVTVGDRLNFTKYHAENSDQLCLRLSRGDLTWQKNVVDPKKLKALQKQMKTMIAKEKNLKLPKPLDVAARKRQVESELKKILTAVNQLEKRRTINRTGRDSAVGRVKGNVTKTKAKLAKAQREMTIRGNAAALILIATALVPAVKWLPGSSKGSSRVITREEQAELPATADELSIRPMANTIVCTWCLYLLPIAPE